MDYRDLPKSLRMPKETRFGNSKLRRITKKTECNYGEQMKRDNRIELYRFILHAL